MLTKFDMPLFGAVMIVATLASGGVFGSRGDMVTAIAFIMYMIALMWPDRDADDKDAE